MKFIIFGHQQHGKDTACEYLNEHYDLSFSSSSMFCAKAFLFEQMRQEHGYQTLEQCFDDRSNHRQYWYEQIRRYNDNDRSRLGKELFALNDIYCGIRDKDEFDAIKQAGLVDLTIWIDASERKPLESTASMKMAKEDADLIIDNNGTLDKLYERLDNLFLALGYSKLKIR